MDAVGIINTYVDERRDELVELLRRLVAAPTVNPPGNETVAAKVLQEYFQGYGIPSETHEAVPGRGNILARIGVPGKTLLVPGHLDVVPAGEGWTVPPLELTIKEGVAYGRGVVDNKGATCAIALAGACIKECFKLKGTLMVAGVADEERGSTYGLEYLMRENKLDVDFAIVPDIAGRMEMIDVAEKGLMDVEVLSYGRQAHASMPELGVNAIWNLIAFLNKLRERELPQVGLHPFLTPPTLNLGIINGGAAANIVPATASAVLDVRFLPGQTADDIMQHLQSVLDDTMAELPDARFEVKLVHALPPTEVASDGELVTALQDASAQITGRKAEVMGLGGATVTKPLITRGIPAVGFGVGERGMAHMADEHVEVDELVAFAKVMALASVRLLGTE